jgi:hypothetical protein
MCFKVLKWKNNSEENRNPNVLFAPFNCKISLNAIPTTQRSVYLRTFIFKRTVHLYSDKRHVHQRDSNPRYKVVSEARSAM